MLGSSADKLCKQFGSRPGPSKCRARSGYKLFDILMVFLKEVFENFHFEKKSTENEKALKITEHAKR